MAEIKLVGSRFTKVFGERLPDFSGELTMKSNIQIISVDKVKDAKETIKIEYAFDIDYGELGKVEIKGLLFLSTDSKTIKDIQKAVKDKKIDSRENITLTNLVMQKASIKAFEIEEELGLPIHIRLPTIEIKNKE